MLIRTALVVVLVSFVGSVRAQTPAPASAQAALLDKYCVTCHSEKLKTGGLSLQGANLTDIPKGAETWEKVIRKLRAGSMPPLMAPHPDKASLNSFAAYLENAIDRAAEAKPNQGTLGTIAPASPIANQGANSQAHRRANSCAKYRGFLGGRAA